MSDKSKTDYDEAVQKGYLGTVPDETPDSAYTIAGVLAGEQTPETQAPGTPGSTKTDPNASTFATTPKSK